jgi:hypothetical protein
MSPHRLWLLTSRCLLSLCMPRRKTDELQML